MPRMKNIDENTRSASKDASGATATDEKPAPDQNTDKAEHKAEQNTDRKEPKAERLVPENICVALEQKYGPDWRKDIVRILQNDLNH